MSKTDYGSYGVPIALPSVDEKGALNIHMVATARGGHSSMPPPHTSIGIMSSIVATLEAHPFPDLIGDESRPSIQLLQCTRDGPLMPRALREALVRLEWAETLAQPSMAAWRHRSMPRWQKIWEWAHTSSLHQRRIEQARRRLIQVLDARTRTLLRTTQAVDLIHGGIKVNALPERTEAMVNHRIAPYSSVNEVLSRYCSLITPLAREMQFALTIDGDELVPASNNTLAHVTISKRGLATDTHAASPFCGPDADPFRLLSQVIRQTWHIDQPPVTLGSLDEDTLPPSSNEWKESIRVSPATMYANTDTRWYHVRAVLLMPEPYGPNFPLWAHVTTPIPDRQVALPACPCVLCALTPDTVDEHVSIDSIVKATEFYTNLVIAVNHETV